MEKIHFSCLLLHFSKSTCLLLSTWDAGLITVTMPGWLRKKIKKLATDLADDVVEQVTQQVTEQLSEQDLGDTVTNLRETGAKTNVLATETTNLCDKTAQTSQKMMDLASDIQSTLQTVSSNGLDASKFQTIQELLSGDKLMGAMALAQDVKQDALQCVEKSVEMMDIMETSMDALPESLQKAIDTAVGGDDDQDEEDGVGETTLDQDVEDIKECITSIQKLNLVTAMDVGLNAFVQLTRKAEVSRSLLQEMHGYSGNVRDISGAIESMDVVTVIRSVKDLWKCLRLTGFMREMAERVGRLIQVVIELFEQTSQKVSGLWKALAFAKSCMSDVTDQLQAARTLCGTAIDKSVMLIDQSRSIKDQLEDMGELNAGSISAFRELSDGDEIRSAIDIAQEMDGQVLQCVEKTMAMIDRVQEGVSNLPPVVTEGIPEDAGKKESDPEPPQIEDDIKDLEASREAIEGANLVLAVKEGSQGFSGVSDKVGICKDMLSVLQGFADSCISAIESFMGVWDLKTAVEKIKEMFRIVNLGQLMKDFADQIKRLILAAIALMKTAVKKFGDLDLSEMAGDLKESVSDAVENVTGLVKDVNLKKLRFWKR